jgi:DeoR/GlpR family transcriptional regulator of sugar metabolism
MQRVVELLNEREIVRVADLAEEFSVSEVTIRSDLAELARQGVAVRVRGGVRRSVGSQSELGFDLRLRAQWAEKCAIAREAAALVDDGEAIALDASTTAYCLALELRARTELVVVTNGLLIAEALAAAPGISVIVTGGMLRRAAMSTVGDLASDVIRLTHIDRGFFGATGVSLEHGLMDLNPDEVRLKREMAQACKQVYGIFDRTKWSKTGLLSFVDTGRLTGIVTDRGAPAAVVGEWEASGVRVMRASAADGVQPPRTPRLHRASTPDER